MLKVQEVGRHLVAGFQGTDMNEDLRELILGFGVGGVILFGRNFESPGQLLELIQKIRDMAGRRIFVGVDQEGGRVARLGEPFTQWAPMKSLGDIGDVELAEQFGIALAKELAAVGIDWDFAPVLDVNCNPDNPIIGDRAFGDDPKHVAKMGVAVIKGMQSQGVMACAKHFPGHGATGQDSHTALPIVLAECNVLDWREMYPFEDAINAGVGSIMTAHVLFPAWDPAHIASCSRQIAGIRLRAMLHFSGLVVCDDMDMAAIKDRYDPIDSVRLAFMSGTDFFLGCNEPATQEEIIRSLFDGRQENILSPELFHQSQKRIEEAAIRFPEPKTGDLSVIGCEEHLLLAEKIKKGQEKQD